MLRSGWLADYPLQDTIKIIRLGDQLLFRGPIETLNLNFQSESDTPIADFSVKDKPKRAPSPQIPGTPDPVGLVLNESPIYVC
jgi:hypothetical protein